MTPKTAKLNPAAVLFLENSDFFTVKLNKEGSTIGDHFLSGFRSISRTCESNQIIHLCASDRLAFALLGKYQVPFLADCQQITVRDLPLLFTRSEKAWNAHPRNYYAAEMMNTTISQLLFGKTLDYSWCHFVLTVGQLSALLNKIKTKDLTILAEMVYLLKDKIKTKEVDWLSWEDPFVFGRNPKILKTERERDPREVKKRLDYVLPIVEYLLRMYTERRNSGRGGNKVS